MLPRRISFDYESLDADRRVVLEGRAARIKERVHRTRQDLIGIGEELIGAKAELGHGQFGAWLEAEFAWSDRFARDLMNVAQVFKSEVTSDLYIPQTALLVLAAPSVPESAREEAIERASNGEHIGTKEVREIIDRHREPSGRSDLPGQGQLFDEGEAEAEEWEGRCPPPPARPISPWTSDDLLRHVRRALDHVDDVARAVEAKEKDGGYGGIKGSLTRLTAAERLRLRAELENLIDHLQGWADQIEEKFIEEEAEEAE